MVGQPLQCSISGFRHMALFKPLDFKLVRFYGRISYSFYLLHPLGILFAYRAINPDAHGDLVHDAARLADLAIYRDPRHWFGQNIG